MKAGLVFAIGLPTLLIGPIVLSGRAAGAEQLPIIVTYELSKVRREARAIQRDPRKFWAGAIVARIEDKKPVTDLALKHPTTVEVTFVVGRDGRLVSKQVARSSGDPSRDARAMAVIETAAPFPPMPDGVGEEQVAFSLPLRFR